MNTGVLRFTYYKAYLSVSAQTKNNLMLQMFHLLFALCYPHYEKKIEM